MSDYELKIKFNQDDVAYYNTNGFKLCFASGVSTSENGQPNYNVVAFSRTIAANVTISWSEVYGIAATSTAFNNGVKFNADTDIIPIALGQSYTQPSDFTNGFSKPDPKAPKSGFNFVNKANGAAAVVFKKVLGKWAPIYLSEKAPLPPGTERLIPKLTCAVWFSADVETDSMISEFDTDPLTLDLTNNASRRAEASYSKAGGFVIEKN